MTIYSKNAFDIAQYMAREAVKVGTDGNGDLDWHGAMIMLKVALGYESIEFAERYYSED